jgi:hypothetical protein
MMRGGLDVDTVGRKFEVRSQDAESVACDFVTLNSFRPQIETDGRSLQKATPRRVRSFHAREYGMQATTANGQGQLKRYSIQR